MQSERGLLEQRIRRLIKLVPDIQDDELRAEITQHLCVLASGLVEATCRDVLKRYAAKRCSPEIVRVVEAHVGGFQNLKVGKIVELLTSFDPIKATEWRTRISEEAAAALDSIVSNRHQIAHGRSIGLSYSVFTRYFADASPAVADIERFFPSY
jgi:hypothetical protein